MKTQKIIPHLWFDPGKFSAEKAIRFYKSIFKNVKIQSITRYGKSGQELHHQKPGSVMTVKFSMEGHEFVGLNGPPYFQFNASVSFFMLCKSDKEIDRVCRKLKEKGQVLMPLDKYDWSPKYAWVQDKFGVHWQLMLEESSSTLEKIVPALFFTGKSHGNAEEAVQFYTSVFRNSKLEGILKYTEEDKNDYALGSVKHAQFQLENQTFMAMDSGVENNFPFNEAISFIIDCQTQDEIDYYWNKLSAVPDAEQCGWLKDKFGVSWQVVPSTLLNKMLQDPDSGKKDRAIASFMQMKKFNLHQLRADFEGKKQEKNKIMERKEFRATINAPREKVWEVLWSKETYPKWTAPFSEGSRAKSDWKEGSKVYFLNAEGEGMVALIDKRKDPEIMNFKHLGMIDKNGNEDLESEKVKSWAGAMENYRLEEKNRATRLIVNMDMDDEYKDYFLKTWPEALEKLKELAENDHAMLHPITISTNIHAPIDKVWEVWNDPKHIENWNAASSDWHTTSASNDLRKGGKISSRMEAKDGSSGFDFEGVYDEVKPKKLLVYTLADGRKVVIDFKENNNSTLVRESFEPESANSREMQQQGWQAILNNFKIYTEKLK
jgi:predicted 3-demethylubiquinone-9 3-methyltransferase (glyoxalase superfamily)/uncharacterized protein YndB with AHSA1/START domain